MPVSIAIVGAGPAGFYTAQALLRTELDCRIDIIERLPTPFGLVRAGVAPDHQRTKQVTRAYEKTALDPNVNYYGNVEIGGGISLFELRRFYDAVVLTTGAPNDRPLDIPGNDLAGVYGAAEFVGWYNGHPNFRHLDPDLHTPGVAVIGNGNVALDIARVLAKTPDEMAVADMPPHATDLIHAAPITDIHVVGRRGPAESKFSNAELCEMGNLADGLPVIDPALLPEAIDASIPERERRVAEKNLATFRVMSGLVPTGQRKRVHFLFHAQPVEILGRDRVSGVRFERTRVVDGAAVGTGDFFEIPCGAVVVAIGYQMDSLDGLPIDRRSGTVINRGGRAGKGLFVAGWAKRGSNGVIGSNKADGDVVARHICEDTPISRKPGRIALERALTAAGVRWVSYGEWKEIDAVEVAAAPQGAPRRKLTHIDDMLTVLDGNPAAKAAR
jgi:NADPH-dependent glutamate synthase beta subunit-like oxidoreductase